MSFRMRYYYIVGIWIFCCALPVMMGCMGEAQKSRKDSFEVQFISKWSKSLSILRNKSLGWWIVFFHL